jgi:hypothetical protein
MAMSRKIKQEVVHAHMHGFLQAQHQKAQTAISESHRRPAQWKKLVTKAQMLFGSNSKEFKNRQNKVRMKASNFFWEMITD